MSFLAMLPGLLDKIVGVVDKVVPDKTAAEKMKFELQSMLLNLDSTEFNGLIENRAKIILAEAEGASYLQRNWRPILMLTIVAIVANNYLICPWFGIMGLAAPLIELPDRLWNLMEIGVGGYVVGRSAEKVVPQMLEVLKTYNAKKV